MRRMGDIDLLEDERLQGELGLTSVFVFLVGTLAGLLLFVVWPHEGLSPAWFLALGVVSVLALPVHELVHAVAFKVMSGGRARVTFGFANAMLYTSAAGTVLLRRRFVCVLLAPAVLVTAALAVVCAALGYPMLGWYLAVIHLSGCTGDLAFVRVIASEPQATHVEDTERGISLLRDE